MNRIKNSNKKLRIFTWHVHGNYLLYLTQSDCDFIIPYDDQRTTGYSGKTDNFPFGDNVHEIHTSKVKHADFDIILFQDDKHYLEDQYKIFSDKQRLLPKIYLEHDPPRNNPVNEKHIVHDPRTLLVHVTHFNKLMWDNNNSPTQVIEHGVLQTPRISYTGKLPKGIVMVNNIHSMHRGQRRMGYDIFEYVRKKIPLDIIGMGSQEIGGLGEIPYNEVQSFLSKYRFFFNPIRYTSLGLSVCEAMMLGMPIIGIATTEMVRTVDNDISGFIDTDIDSLINFMQELLKDPTKAKKLGQDAQKYALQHFSIWKFTHAWEDAFRYAINLTAQSKES